MTAELAPFVKDVMALWPLWAVIGTGLSGLVLWAFKAWVRINIVDPLASMRGEHAATHHLLTYHLGPNGDTKPLHHRVADVEQAVGVHAPPAGTWPRETKGEQG